MLVMLVTANVASQHAAEMQQRWGVSYAHGFCPFFKLVVLRNNQWLIQVVTLEAVRQISLRTLQSLGRCCTNILKYAVVFWDKRGGFDVCENTLKQMPRVSFKCARVKASPSCFTLLEGAMFSSAAPSLSLVCARPGRESGGVKQWQYSCQQHALPFLTKTHMQLKNFLPLPFWMKWKLL